MELEEWLAHPWISGATTNPSLFRAAGATDYLSHARTLAGLTDKPISIDGPAEQLWCFGDHVYVKTTRMFKIDSGPRHKINFTAVCHVGQIPSGLRSFDIISVFAGRIMDTGRDPQKVIDHARDTGAQVLWASVREPYNIHQAERAGCDIVTVPPAILRKYLDWNGKPLEVVAAETIAQFERDSAWT